MQPKNEWVGIKIAVSFFPHETFRPTSFSWENAVFCSSSEWCWLTVHVAQMEVSIDEWGSIVEVLGHVIQPVGLHAFDPLITVLNPQWHLYSVVLHLALSDWRVVVQSEQFHPCWETTENNPPAIDLTWYGLWQYRRSLCGTPMFYCMIIKLLLYVGHNPKCNLAPSVGALSLFSCHKL